MPLAPDYNDAVRSRFGNPVHAGDLPEAADTYDRVLEVDQASGDDFAHVVLTAGVRGDTIAALRFRARGCPHLVAAADLACEKLEGNPVGALENFPRDDITVTLAVPVEKTGRVLLLEDAVASLWAQWTAK